MKFARVTTAHLRAVTSTTFVATLSSLLFGYCTAVISGVVGSLQHLFITPRGLGELASNALLGLAVCAVLLGTVLGALTARRAAELMGRRKPMIIAAVLFLVSALGSAFPEAGLAPLNGLGADALWPFIFYRLLGGVAVGLASVIAPMHVAEFAPSAVRGQLGAYQQIAIAGGIAIALCVNWGIALQGDDLWVLETGWRWMMVSLLVPSLVFLWLAISVHESPAWLVRQGRVEEARRNLAQSAEPADVDGMLEELAADARQVQTPTALFTFGKGVVIIGVALSVLQQIMGISAMSYYGPMILQRMGYHLDDAMLGVLLARFLNLLATMMVVLLVDRVGRRPLLIWGAMVMGLASMTLGSLFHVGVAEQYGLAALCLYMAGLGMSFGPIVWILMSEIYPPAIRAQAMSLAIAAQWIANFLVSFTFPLMFGDSTLNAFANGGVAFWVYGACGLLAAYVVLHFVPETKGLDATRVSHYWQAQSATPVGGSARS